MPPLSMTPPDPKSPPSPLSMRPLALVMAIAACLFFIGLGRLPLIEPDEGRNAEVAREMIVTHDWITPHYDGLPYLDKPTALFWMIAGSFRVFGISQWSARFPEALAALATILLTWLMGRRMFDERTGMIAGIILAASPLFFGFARTVIFDMPLTFFVTASLLCLFLNSRTGYASWRLDAAAFASMGVGTLTKGPVAFLLPLLTLLVYHALAGKFRDMRKIHWGLGWLALLAVTLPWFIDVSVRNPDFPKYAFWDESLLRFTTGAHMHRSNGILYYIPVYLAGFFPWSFFLLFAGWKRIKNWRTMLEAAHREELFLLTWAGVVFVFFTLSHSKLPGYFLPALVPLSVLAGKAWRNVQSGHAARTPGWVGAGFAAVTLSGLAMAALAESFHFVPSSAKVLSRIPPSVLRLLPSSLFHGAVILGALGILGWRFARRTGDKARGWPAFAAAALALPLLTVALLQPLAWYARDNSSRELAETIQQSPEKALPVYGYYYFRTGLPFYMQRPIGLVTEDGDQSTSNYITSRFGSLRDAPGETITPRASSGPALLTAGPLIDGLELKALVDGSGRPFLLMARNGNVADLLSAYPRMEPMWTSWQYSILRVPETNK